MKKLKVILDVTTNVVVVVFAVVAIGVLVKNYFAPRDAETSAGVAKGSAFPEIAGVDLDKLGIHTTPTLVLVDSTGKVLESWRGALQPDGEREVFDALGLPYKQEAGSTPTAANVKKTADIFDEQKAVLSLRPHDSPRNDPAHFVEVCDVNGKGDAYLVYDKFMYQYDADGRLKDARPLPPDFRSPFCVDDGGNIYAVGERGLSVFSPELVKLRDVSLGDRLPREAFTLRNVQAVGCDTADNCARNDSNNCYCPNVSLDGTGCNGCFVPNGSSGCGTCHRRAGEELPAE